MIRYGYINGCFQPLTKGHCNLIVQAAREVDYLCVWFSATQRDKETNLETINEFLWQELMSFLQNQGLVNIRFIKTEKSPRKDVLVHLHWFDSDCENKHLLFSDQNDMISTQQLVKFCPNLIEKGLIEQTTVHREQTEYISGTQMRGWLKQEEQQKFSNGLPCFISESDKLKLWQMIQSKK
jgi:cytidyltransferase-like protein